MRAAIVVFTLAGCALAQEPAQPLFQQDSRPMTPLDTTLDGVWRDRGELRGELPVELVGIEQGDNSFRARTPALERSDRAVARVDEEALRERRLAILAGESFDATPLPQVADAAPPAPAPRRELPAAPPESGGWRVPAVIGVFALLLAWVGRSIRSR